MTATTLKAQARDLEADLAICEAATPGPWISNRDAKDERFKDELIWGFNGPGFGAIAEVFQNYPEHVQNERFIAEAREGWPYAIRRALGAEAEVDRLRDEIRMLQEQLEQRRRGCPD